MLQRYFSVSRLCCSFVHCLQINCTCSMSTSIGNSRRPIDLHAQSEILLVLPGPWKIVVHIDACCGYLLYAARFGTAWETVFKNRCWPQLATALVVASSACWRSMFPIGRQIQFVQNVSSLHKAEAGDFRYWKLSRKQHNAYSLSVDARLSNFVQMYPKGPWGHPTGSRVCAFARTA